MLDRMGGFLVDNVPGAVAGPNVVQIGIDQALPGWGPSFVAIASFLFAFTSHVFFVYVATTNLVFLLGEKHSSLPEALRKVGSVATSFIGSVVQAETIKDYDRQRAAGVDPVFDP